MALVNADDREMAEPAHHVVEPSSVHRIQRTVSSHRKSVTLLSTYMAQDIQPRSSQVTSRAQVLTDPAGSELVMAQLCLFVTQSQLAEVNAFFPNKDYSRYKQLCNDEHTTNGCRVLQEWQVQWPDVHAYQRTSDISALQKEFQYCVAKRSFHWWKLFQFDLEQQGKDRGLTGDSLTSAVLAVKQHKLYLLVTDATNQIRNWRRAMATREVDQNAQLNPIGETLPLGFSEEVSSGEEIPMKQRMPSRSRSPSRSSRRSVVSVASAENGVMARAGA